MNEMKFLPLILFSLRQLILVLLINFIWSKPSLLVIGFMNSLDSLDAASFCDIQINLKSPKHLILVYNLTKISTSLLMAQNLCYQHFCMRVFSMNWCKNKILYMQCCLKQPNRRFRVNKVSLPISEKSGSNWNDSHFKGFSWFSNMI
jgi:hypothetical protein